MNGNIKIEGCNQGREFSDCESLGRQRRLKEWSTAAKENSYCKGPKVETT